jgi:nucleotide-binding universal stress UspA family protein
MFETIAVGTDGSETADKAVEIAFDIASRYAARLVVISVYAPIDEARLERERAETPEELQWVVNPHEDVDALLSKVAERAHAHGLQAVSVARRGEPANVICELAEEQGADLLVIGNKGIQRRVFGSVPKWIAQHAPCSVVIAKTT